MVCSRSQKYKVTCRTVDVGQTAAMSFPDITNLPESFGGVKPPGRLVYPHGVESLQTGEILRPLVVSPYHPTTIPFYTNNATMLPQPPPFLPRLPLLPLTTRRGVVWPQVRPSAARVTVIAPRIMARKAQVGKETVMVLGEAVAMLRELMILV